MPGAAPPAAGGPNPERAAGSGRLTVLGCDGSYPGPGGAASGYVVEGGGATVWLDAGTGTFAALQLVMDPARVDAVVLSHEHPDHWTDLDSFAVWLRERERTPGRTSDGARPVRVLAPPGLRRRAYFGDDSLLEWLEVEPSHRVVVRPRRTQAEAGLVCSFSATDHGPPTLAVRVEPVDEGRFAHAPPPRAFGYSADTGADWSPEELGPGIGVLLCEATFLRDEEGSARHLSGRQAGMLAAAAGVGTLVLTHRRPSVPAERVRAEGAEAFGREVEQAAPRAVFGW